MQLCGKACWACGWLYSGVTAAGAADPAVGVYAAPRLPLTVIECARYRTHLSRMIYGCSSVPMSCTMITPCSLHVELGKKPYYCAGTPGMTLPPTVNDCLRLIQVIGVAVSSFWLTRLGVALRWGRCCNRASRVRRRNIRMPVKTA